MASRILSPVALVGGQALLAIGGLFGLYMQPPANGQMLLVPLAAQTQGELAGFAVSNDLSIVQTGSLPGTLVVRGERDRLGWALRDHGVLVLATAPRGCTPA